MHDLLSLLQIPASPLKQKNKVENKNLGDDNGWMVVDYLYAKVN